MGSLYPTGIPYSRATYSNNMGFSLEGSQNSLTDEHPSPGSEDSSQWDDPDGAVPLAEISPPPAHIDGLPLHEVTESYLRQTLSIFPPRPVDLTALPDEPSARQPRIADMIKLAIWGSRAKKLTLRQIYDAIETRYPAWRDQVDKPWQRSIRHNLSLKAIFVQVPRPISSQGKGNYWTLDTRKGELNKRSRRRRDGTAESSKPNAFEDLDPDHHFLHGPTFDNLERSGPKNDFHSDYANPKANAYALRMSPIHRQGLYSEQQPSTGWNFPSSSPSYVPMDASAMNLPRATAYPPMDFRPNVGHHMQVQDGGPTAEHAYVFPGMNSMQGCSPTDNARPSRTRVQNPGSDVAAERGTEAILRTARRYAGQ
ncbi:hypothetical protein GALMADRAFT_1254388 [Galerina marginata CBS 339.88]|uniref:Fork-head domain-containing protein n=1 Tax=Galerina marginata (strain CBS 339.88) TaxID=685588 RepID=A0A067THT9_GALM3|nr:hypothetical protein GALMADRAFT_1254388 [Galerina marginata CBS 339.88]